MQNKSNKNANSPRSAREAKRTAHTPLVAPIAVIWLQAIARNNAIRQSFTCTRALTFVTVFSLTKHCGRGRQEYSAARRSSQDWPQRCR